MSSENRLALLSVDQRNQIEAMLMEFDESWQPGLIEEYVQKIPTDSDPKLQKVTVSEFVKIDLQRSWEVQRGRSLEEYCQKYPALGSAEQLDPELILVEYEARRVKNPALDLSSYESRFPKQFQRLSALLSQFRQSDASLHTLKPEDQASIQTSRVANLRDTAAGKKNKLKPSDLPIEFGRYRLIRELGAGAMGAVYLAHDTQLDRQVALKTPSFDGVKDEELITRFYREARAAAKLQHRNICPIYDVGEIDGRHFISMAFIKGRCLSEYVSTDKRPPLRTTAILVLRLATALAEAHHHNVVHRDLKPANIMVDLKKEPVVMDFGLARQTDVETRMTQSGMIVGTPAYMSPEQVTGDQQEVGPQSDIYALGVILYELLTGQLPVRGSIAQIVYQITSEEPTPPSQIRSEIDPELEAICNWMMTKDRGTRFQSMGEVADALRKYLKTPNVTSEAAVSQKYERPSVVKSNRPQVKSEQDSSDSTRDSSAALKEYFEAEEAADPLRTMIDPVQADSSSLRRKRSGSRTGNRNRSFLIASGIAGGLILLLGIIMLFRTPYGMVRVELQGDVEGLEVLVDGQRISLTDAEEISAEKHPLALRIQGVDLPFDESTNQFIVTQNGTERRLEVAIGQTKLSNQMFEVSRDGETVLTIQLQESHSLAGRTNGQQSAPHRDWISLFDGRSLKGWRIEGDEEWTVENGELVGTAQHSRLVTEQTDFKDVEIRVECLLDPDANSGVFARTIFGEGWKSGVEAQLSNQITQRTLTGGILGHAYNQTVIPDENWFELRFRIIGREATVFINDQQTFSCQVLEDVPHSGAIGLQCMNAKEVRFRKVEYRRIDASSTGSDDASTRPELSNWQSLFNGRDLTGWDGDPRLWRVDDGVITGQTTGSNVAKDNTCLIWRRGGVSDFHLKLEYKLTNGNSGIQYRSAEVPAKRWVVRGYQADMDDEHIYTGGLYGEKARGLLAKLGQKIQIDSNSKTHLIGTLGDAEALQSKISGRGWNEYEIIARGNRLIHKINGVVTMECVDEDLLADGRRADRGLLALQLHKGPPMKVEFRNIQLRDLTETQSGDSQDAQGWTTLFDGESLSDWKVHGTDDWSVSNGEIVCRGNNSKLIHEIGPLTDFDIQLESYLEPGTNSGLFLHTGQNANHRDGYEIQLGDFKEYGTGSVWGRVPFDDPIVEDSKWFLMEVQVRENRISVTVDGRLIVDYADPKREFKTGYVGLQGHQGSGLVKFRNLRLKRYNEALPEQPVEDQFTIENEGGGGQFAISPDGLKIVTTGSGSPGRFTVWDARSGDQLLQVTDPDHAGMYTYGHRFSPDGKHLIYVVGKSVKVVNLETKAVEQEVEFPASPKLACFPNRNWAVALYYERPVNRKDRSDVPQRLRIWDWENDRTLYDKVLDSVRTVSVSPDGKYVIRSHEHRHLRHTFAWDGTTLTLGPEVKFEDTSRVRSPLCFSPDGRFAANSLKSRKGMAVLLDVATGRIVRYLEPELAGANNEGQEFGASVAFTHDGTQIVTANHLGRIALWDRASGELVREIAQFPKTSNHWTPRFRWTGRHESNSSALLGSSFVSRSTVCRHESDSSALLGSSGCEATVVVRELETLRELIFVVESLNDNGLAKLAQLPRLETLELYHTDVTDDGLKSLADFPALRVLKLGVSRKKKFGAAFLTDAGLAHLSAIDSLKRIWLSGPAYSDAAIDHLAKLQQLEQIAVWAPLSDAGMVELQRRLPNCSIVDNRRTPEPDEELAEFVPEVVAEDLLTKSASGEPEIHVLTELNRGDYNTSPWPSKDGLRLYWEGQHPSSKPTAKDEDPFRSKLVTLMATRENRYGRFGAPKIVAEGRMATLSPDELEIVCLPNSGVKVLHSARRNSLDEPFTGLRPLIIVNQPTNPKSPSFSESGLQLVVQSGAPEQNGFLLSTRTSISSRWSAFRQFGHMHERYFDKPLTWPFLTDNGLRLWYGSGGDRATEIWTGTRGSTDEAFRNIAPVLVDNQPLVGRAPRYLASTDELFYARPVGEHGWELAILKNYSHLGASQPEFVSLINGKDLSGWTVIGHNGWKVENGTLIGRTSPAQKGWLMSDQAYLNFELKMEYLIGADSNSGVFLRGQSGIEKSVNGYDFYEIQLLDETSEKFRDAALNQRTGSLYQRIAANPVLRPKPNEWHDLAIRLEGLQLKVSIDGKVVIDSPIPEGKSTRGHIGLQLYSHEVRFRNMRIRELD